MRKNYFENVVFEEKDLARVVGNNTTPLEQEDDLNPLMNYIGDARYVMLGAASHGTHEYNTWRMKITKRLIKEKGFSFVAIEGDWPDCYKVNRYVKGYSDGGENPVEILTNFNRWPTWMWANWEMVAFIDWMKYYNEHLPLNKKIGFYGLDVYSLWESLEAIVEYLKVEDRKTMLTAIKAMNCFDKYGKDEGLSYARAASIVPEPCTKEVVELLSEIRANMKHYNSDVEAPFNVEQNAIVALNVEKYYRSLLKGGALSWNIREKHMMETLNRLMNFYGKYSKVVVWEHNTHIGDARAIEMPNKKMENLGQLTTQQHADEGVVLVGFGSYKGSVIASESWGGEMLKMHVPEAIETSWEHILHLAGGGKNKLLLFDKLRNVESFGYHISHRNIGVVYNSTDKQQYNYEPSILPMRYDAFLYFEETKSLQPIQVSTDKKQTPETFPFGI